MSASRVSLNHVHLHYPTVSYAHRSLMGMLSGMAGKGPRIPKLKDIHALKNVSVEIQRGERVGLLGHNGAGKSTFLKVVAGLYPISGGEVSVEGRIRSLFEISMGFEPDATGRANILYRGLLLGLSPKEMRDREAEIVSFADLGEFIDYPLSTYSAGMQVRLAFAISTFVSGEVLLLDEVMGAGDANFMLKAKARITELIKQSEILILASHDLATLSSICDRVLVFHHGEMVFDGPALKAIAEYRRLNGLLHG